MPTKGLNQMTWTVEGLLVAGMGSLAGVITTLAGIVGMLWKLQKDEAVETRKALAECETDRLDLWRTIADLSAKASGESDLRTNSVKEVKEMADSKIAKLERKNVC